VVTRRRFPAHYREANVAIAPDGSPCDYIGLGEPWPEWCPRDPVAVVDAEGNLVPVDDVGEWGYIVPAGWKP
jgi:hypothetical protein